MKQVIGAFFEIAEVLDVDVRELEEVTRNLT